ncbi:MAG: hypothetical protein MUF20_13865 [Methylotetracoccus sp.]|nr:hypothetical protein [Methylotetracoccus sp.]
MAVWQMGFLSDEVRNLARRLFSVGLENNIGAWWSGALLVLAAVHSFDGFRRYQDEGATKLALAWLVIAGVLVGLSLDEVGSLHERVGQRGGWWALLPFGVVIIAAVTWASWQMWTSSVERRSIKLIAVAFALFAATAGNEYLEHALEWPAWLRPWRAGFEEGLELVGMLILISVAMRHSGEAFREPVPGEAPRPCLWVSHSMPVGLLLAAAAVTPFFAVLSAGLTDTHRGRPADWLAMTMFLLAALAAWRSVLCANRPERYPGRVGVGVLLLLASAASVAIYPHWQVDLGFAQFNARLTVISFLLLGITSFAWMRDHAGGLRAAYVWLGAAGLSGVLAMTAQGLLFQQLATQWLAVLAYALAAPQVVQSIGAMLGLKKKATSA